MTDRIESNLSFGYETTLKPSAEKVETDAFKNAMEVAAQNKDLKGLEEACQQFESFFIQKLFAQMRSSSAAVGGFLEKSSARETFEKMLDEELSKEMSKAGGIGLSKVLFENMKKAYEMETESTTPPKTEIDSDEASSLLNQIK